MLRRIVQNAVVEFSMGYAKRVEISVDVVSNSITVTDDGAGIPKRGPKSDPPHPRRRRLTRGLKGLDHPPPRCCPLVRGQGEYLSK